MLELHIARRFPRWCSSEVAIVEALGARLTLPELLGEQLVTTLVESIAGYLKFLISL